jgi:hypothetical protein
MAVDHVEVLVEERSMEAALAVLLPTLLGKRISFAIAEHLVPARNRSTRFLAPERLLSELSTTG